MKYVNRLKKTYSWLYFNIAILLIALMLGMITWLFLIPGANIADPAKNTSSQNVMSETAQSVDPNPLAGLRFYRDDSREVTKQAKLYPELKKISTRPGTVWLTNDPYDYTTVYRTSRQAKKQGTVPIYQLYAIPNRDACAAYSKGGFTTSTSYLRWVDKIIANLGSKAIFAVEADAVANVLERNCMTATQINARLSLINKTVTRLKASSKVVAVYIDAAHAEWFPNVNELVSPLLRAGVTKADGVAVNVSNFVSTTQMTTWSQKLIKAIKTAAKTTKYLGAIIDTSRNGNGVPPPSVTGVARWCNPSGRAIGNPPTTAVSSAAIDAYFWGKVVGESDGACFGYPPAGTFILAKALEMARNADY